MWRKGGKGWGLETVGWASLDRGRRGKGGRGEEELHNMILVIVMLFYDTNGPSSI